MNAPAFLSNAYVDAAARIISNPGFAEIAIPGELEGYWPKLVEDTRRLIVDPRARSGFAPQVDGHDEVGWPRDVGLYQRTTREKKWFFHFAQEHDRSIPGAIAGYERYIQDLAILSHQALHIAIAIAKECDVLLGTSCNPLANAFKYGWVMTRVLLYEDRPPEKPDATTHFDSSGMTVHWGTTHPGLVLFDQYGKRHVVAECDLTKAAVFPGKKFPAVYQDPALIRGLHGVRDSRRDSGCASIESRVSLVSFVHPRLTEDMVRWIRGHEHVFDSIETRHPL